MKRSTFFHHSGILAGLLSLAKWPCVPLLLQSRVSRDSKGTVVNPSYILKRLLPSTSVLWFIIPNVNSCVRPCLCNFWAIDDIDDMFTVENNISYRLYTHTLYRCVIYVRRTINVTCQKKLINEMLLLMMADTPNVSLPCCNAGLCNSFVISTITM